MTDTTRPTVEALAAELEAYRFDDAAEVLGALLTERDEAVTRSEVLLVRAERAEAQITAVQRSRALDQPGYFIDAILSRGAQDAAEHDRDRRNDGEGIAVGAMTEPWVDPYPWLYANGDRRIEPEPDPDDPTAWVPRTRSQYDAEEGAQ